MQWRCSAGQRGVWFCVIKVSDIGHRVWRLYAAAHLGHCTVGGEWGG